MRGNSKKSALVVTILITAIFNWGCGQSDGLVRKHAPQSKTDVGIIVSNANEKQVAELAANQQVQYRKLPALNKEHESFEVFGLSQDQIKAQLPQAKTWRNDFFTTHGRSTDISKITNMAMELLNEEAQPSEASFNKCIEDAKELPQAIIDVIAPAEAEASDLVVEVDDLISLLGDKSHAHSNHPSNIKVGWVVIPPDSSSSGQGIKMGHDINYRPDVSGLHSLILVVQDDRDACGLAYAEVAVTLNREFVRLPASELNTADTVDMEQFTHLKELKASAVWQKSQGEGITIAVIDTGVHYNHRSLNANIATNDKEIPGNNIDDDQNGIVDDYSGYDFAFGDALPYDDQGHGSHVAGLAASPVFGLAPKAKILPIKGLGPKGGDIASISAAIIYAVDSGAQVINMSFGNYGAPHPKMLEAIDYAESKGSLVIAAAGNGHPFTGLGIDTDIMPNFPSAFPHENIVAVAAKDSVDALSSYSNFGLESVDVVAPGGGNEDLMSAYMENPQGVEHYGMSGTSMAAPVVAGISALVLAVNPELTATEVKDILMQSGSEVDELKPIIASGRHLSAVDSVDKALASVFAQPLTVN